MSAQPRRLPRGGRIDRGRPLAFRFDGQALEGFAGDTLASALIANGVSIVGRSFKYHRPRGIVGLGAEEPNAILQIGSGPEALPNLRATQVELAEGLSARSTRGWPSAQFDLAGVTDALGSLLGAGFYYKTFMRPRAMWGAYEHLLRSGSGFGTAPTGPDPDRYRHCNAHCDVLVVGAGPAGIMAALAAGAAGGRVILADEQGEPGGSLLASSATIDDMPAAEWAGRQLAELAGMPEVIVLSRTTAFGYFDHNFLTLAERRWGERVRERLWRVRAKQVVLAQGAFERPIVFCNNDRPGVMLASAAAAYALRYAAAPGECAVVFTNNDSAYRAALELSAAGIEVAALADSRRATEAPLADRVRDAGIEVLSGAGVSDIRGRARVRAARVGDRWIDCDLVAVSGGWNPAVHLHSQSGGRIEWDDARLCFVPGKAAQASFSAGACAGRWSLQDCLRDGLQAGTEAARRAGLGPGELPLPDASEHTGDGIQALWQVPSPRGPDRGPRQFIDYQNDTTTADIRLAVREGYRNVEHVKRYTALGFGTDQGKLGNINGMAILAECLGTPVAQVGTTTFRPAYTPVTFGTLAGECVGANYDPVRRTAIHAWHEARGALFEPVGQWLRAWYFPREGEDLDAAVARECLAVRNAAGIMDASTLGKIDVRGPDALEFLERIYTHDVGRLSPGRCAYGVMLGEDGMVKDDGVVACLGEEHYYLTTTTGGAATVLAWMEAWLQTEWPHLEVYLTSLTEHFSTFAVAGPASRRILEAAGCDIALDSGDFPFMSLRNGRLAGVPVRLFRVSFNGELAFEVNVDSAYADRIWEELTVTGAAHGITPYGTEAMHVLRAEKGYIIVGQETDGSVTPLDLGMNWLVSKGKDFLGKRSLSRPDAVRKGRKQLVGLLSADGTTRVPEGAQLVDDPGIRVPVPACGHVTSSYHSACLGHPIALALVRDGSERHGETVHATVGDGRFVPMTITSPVFYDPAGERQRA